MAWTEKGLFSRICSFENLLLAERKARRGKGTKPAVLAFWLDAERQLPRLRDELLSRTWRPKGYTRFVAHESKDRLISAAPYADRVVHHAVMNVVGPVLERSFIHDSYANRKGKGTHRALLRCSRFCRNAGFVLKCDIADYFGSVDHDILMGMLRRRIADEDALRLMEAIVRSGASIGSGADAAGAWPAGPAKLAMLATGGGMEFRRPPELPRRPSQVARGLPIGNLTSQCLANAYLDGFDHFVKEDLRVRRYLRYVDDFAVFGDDAAWLEGVREGMAGYLGKRLNLVLHPRKTRIFSVSEGVDFLGFRVFPGHRLLRKTAGYHYQRMLFRLAWERREGTASLGAVRNSFASWSAHAAWGKTAGLRRHLLAEADARGAGLEGPEKVPAGKVPEKVCRKGARD
jgi:retron-type reverse transcriptase